MRLSKNLQLSRIDITTVWQQSLRIPTRILRNLRNSADNEFMTDHGADRPAKDTRVGPDMSGISALRRVLDAAAVPTATLDGEGQIVSLNPAFARLCGRGSSEILGLHLLSLCPGRDQADVLSKLVRIVGAISEIEQEELRVTGADGRVRTLALTLGGLTGADGRVEQVLAIASDLTAERRSMRNLRQESVERARDVLADADTGFPNQRALAVMIGSAARRSEVVGSPFAVLRCHLTNLGEIRDSRGEAAARAALGAVAERLSQRLRGEDTVTRSAVDAFTVLAEDLGDVQDAAGVAYRLLASVVEPVRIDAGTELAIDMVIGVAVADGAASPEEVLSDSMQAASDARRDGVGGFRMIDTRKVTAA